MCNLEHLARAITRQPDARVATDRRGPPEGRDDRRPGGVQDELVAATAPPGSTFVISKGWPRKLAMRVSRSIGADRAAGRNYRGAIRGVACMTPA
jgi:hypothetical protein